MRLLQKLIQGSTVAVLAVVGAQVAMMLLVEERQSRLSGLALSVGVPSFLAAVFLFPVSPAVGASRWRLGLLVFLATLSVCVANRLLIFRAWERDNLAELLPDPAALDGNAKLLLAALGTSLVMMFVAQPAMVWAARRAPPRSVG
ncbi:MAG: hypothetical protein GQE15_21925 [Archangiaceae bacterium]|nr:hypothetical protein [Archangiaceae bacterium]